MFETDSFALVEANIIEVSCKLIISFIQLYYVIIELMQTFQPLLRRNREALLVPKALRRAPTARASRGVWGHAPPPRKFCKFSFSQVAFPAC